METTTGDSKTRRGRRALSGLRPALGGVTAVMVWTREARAATEATHATLPSWIETTGLALTAVCVAGMAFYVFLLLARRSHLLRAEALVGLERRFQIGFGLALIAAVLLPYLVAQSLTVAAVGVMLLVLAALWRVVHRTSDTDATSSIEE